MPRKSDEVFKEETKEKPEKDEEVTTPKNENEKKEEEEEEKKEIINSGEKYYRDYQKKTELGAQKDKLEKCFYCGHELDGTENIRRDRSFGQHGRKIEYTRADHKPHGHVRHDEYIPYVPRMHKRDEKYEYKQHQNIGHIRPWNPYRGLNPHERPDLPPRQDHHLGGYRHGGQDAHRFGRHEVHNYERGRYEHRPNPYLRYPQSETNFDRASGKI